jgi:hypothetical protein
MRISFVAAVMLIGVGGPLAAQTAATGVFFVSQNDKGEDYLVDSATIATPAGGYKTATVYWLMQYGVGSTETWQIRCKDLGVKVTANREYQQFSDGTWGDKDFTDAKPEYDVKTKAMSQGEVADFVCRWPALKHSSAIPNLSADPDTRIKTLILVAAKAAQ